MCADHTQFLASYVLRMSGEGVVGDLLILACGACKNVAVNNGLDEKDVRTLKRKASW